MTTIVLAARVILAAVFATAGIGKLFDLDGSRKAMADFGVPERFARAAGTALPVAELLVAFALLPEPTGRWSAVGALVLLLAFIAGIAAAMARGEEPDCHCFGTIHSAPAGKGALIRNAVLAAIALLIIADGPGRSLADLGRGRGGSTTNANPGHVAVAIQIAVTMRLWNDKQGLQHSLRDAQISISRVPAGLALGSHAPWFALPTADEDMLSIQDLCDRGKPVVLIFMEPGCGPCGRLFPDLLSWKPAIDERLTIAVVARRPDTEAEVDMSAENEEGVSVITLLQDENEIAEMFRLRSSPSALIVNQDGRIASSLAEGPPAIEALIRVTLQRGPVSLDEATSYAPPALRGAV
jgi:uncharacterized membrane protein YphA (DoxX/SURF4 family)